MARKTVIKAGHFLEAREIFGVVLNGEVISESSAELFQTEPEVDPDPWLFDLPSLPHSGAQAVPAILPAGKGGSATGIAAGLSGAEAAGLKGASERPKGPLRAGQNLRAGRRASRQPARQRRTAD